MHRIHSILNKKNDMEKQEWAGMGFATWKLFCQSLALLVPDEEGLPWVDWLSLVSLEYLDVLDDYSIRCRNK
jgi:hypothetical protein